MDAMTTAARKLAAERTAAMSPADIQAANFISWMWKSRKAELAGK